MKVLQCLTLLVLLFLFGACYPGSAQTYSSKAAPKRSDAAEIPPANVETLPGESWFVIPGPLRSFLRMAGISQETSPEEVIPHLSRQVFMQGYNDGRPTEFLILLRRYVEQSRELALLAGPDAMIRITNCDDVKPLLRILGYQVRPTCGQPGTSLKTDDSERAFLTIDSGFPLTELEKTLQGGGPFQYSYSPAGVPVLFAQTDWTMASKNNHMENSRDFLDTLLRDPQLARLYWGLSRLDSDTAIFLRRSQGIRSLLPYARALDFYGSHICIREGRVLVPGGDRAESAWENLVGASPRSPADFIPRLLKADRGWLAAYFDVLSRASGSSQQYFTEPHRLRDFYGSLRVPTTGPTATTGSYRPAPGLLLLVANLQLEPSGKPRVPGNLDIWNDIVRQTAEFRTGVWWRKRVGRIMSPDQLVEVMFALSRSVSSTGPLQTYLALSGLESGRFPDHALDVETFRLLANKFPKLGDQYRIFSEFPELDDASIVRFINVAEGLDRVPVAIRGNALGTFEANIGIWQILARQGQIAERQLNDSWQKVVEPFAQIRSSAQIYDAGRTSLEAVVRAATGKPQASQAEIIELLAGPQQSTPQGIRVHREIANKMSSVLEAQRLVSLDTVLVLGNSLREKARGKVWDEAVIRRAGEIREFEMPRPIFTNGERTEWAAGVYNNHHTDLEMKSDVGKVLQSASATSTQIEDATGQLSSFLRDSLVGLNYAYYEPPGAEALHNNPLFVRSHDFSAETVSGIETSWQAPQVYGEGSPAGGGAHLVGSLADLPYVLARMEQDFIAPEHLQALIWQELVPGLLTNAILPRWWNISPAELHAVTLYQRTGEELLTAAAKDEAMRNQVTAILADRFPPRQLSEVERSLGGGQVQEMLSRLTPADTFFLALDFQRKYSLQAFPDGGAAKELQDMCSRHPEQVNWERLSKDFGVPHPVLAQTYARSLLNIAPVPAFSGFASRLLAESWESPNLYWARMADEAGYSPVTLNSLIPELTRAMVAKISATDYDDYPALLRALRETGEQFRRGENALPAGAEHSRY